MREERLRRTRYVISICHATWLLVEAGIAKNVKMTSYHSIKLDVINAGVN